MHAAAPVDLGSKLSFSATQNRVADLARSTPQKGVIGGTSVPIKLSAIIKTSHFEADFLVIWPLRTRTGYRPLLINNNSECIAE